MILQYVSNTGIQYFVWVHSTFTAVQFREAFLTLRQKLKSNNNKNEKKYT